MIRSVELSAPSPILQKEERAGDWINDLSSLCDDNSIKIPQILGFRELLGCWTHGSTGKRVCLVRVWTLWALFPILCLTQLFLLDVHLYPFSSVHFSSVQFSSVQSLSHVQLFATPWIAARQASLSITNSLSSLKLMFQWVSDAIQPSPPLLSFLPSIFPSISLFQWVSFCIRWPKYWSLQLQQQSFNEYKGLISFRIDWFHLCAVQGPLKSLLQHHSLKASILQCSDFFMV